MPLFSIYTFTTTVHRRDESYPTKHAAAASAAVTDHDDDTMLAKRNHGLIVNLETGQTYKTHDDGWNNQILN